MSFAELLILWYIENKRELPWRDTQDPYSIWLSEIMLQQTRIQQVYEYYERFLQKWKTVEELAKASEEEVLKAWEGLGYYSRARNLHQTSKMIAHQYEGKFPNTYQALEKLPGIGSYTSRAIASFAFGQPVVALDGNGFRVITRILDIDLPINQTKNQKFIQKLADELLENAPSKDFNYALMDLGNLICKPTNPLCGVCPVQSKCLAFQGNTQVLRPVKIKDLKRGEDYLVFYWMEQNSRIALLKKKRNYWKGLYVFPFQKLESKDWYSIQENVLYEVKHLLTHKDLYIKVIGNNWDNSLHEVEWIEKKKLKEKPFPKPLLDFVGRIDSC